MRLFLLLVLVPQIASAASLSFFGNTAGDKRVSTKLASDIRLDSAVVSHAEGYSERVSLSPAPVSLAILVDSSRLCAFKKIDELLISKLQKMDLHPDSRLTVITYDSEGTQLLLKDASPSELGRLGFSCRMEAQSAPVESAMELLISQTEITDDQIFWIFSSGNTQVGPKSRKAFRNHAVRFTLFNPLAGNDVKANLAGFSKEGSFQLVSSTSLPLVSYYTFSFSPPKALQGKTSRFNFSYEENEGKTLSTGFEMAVPYLEIDYFAIFIKTLLFLAAASCGGFLIYKTVNFYRPKYCQVCKKPVVSSERCVSCTPPETAFLIGQTNYREPNKWKKQDVTLVGKRLSIGTRGSCTIRVPKTKGMSRGKFLEILRDSDASGNIRYRLIPLRAASRYRMELNDLPIAHPTSLSDGDLLKINGMEMTFLLKGNHHA